MDKRMLILTRRNGLRRRGGASGRKEAMKDTSMAPKLKVQTNGSRGPFYSRRSRLILFTRERWSVIGGEASWLRCREGRPTRCSMSLGSVFFDAAYQVLGSRRCKQQLRAWCSRRFLVSELSCAFFVVCSTFFDHASVFQLAVECHRECLWLLQCTPRHRTLVERRTE